MTYQYQLREGINRIMAENGKTAVHLFVNDGKITSINVHEFDDVMFGVDLWVEGKVSKKTARVSVNGATFKCVQVRGSQ